MDAVEPKLFLGNEYGSASLTGDLGYGQHYWRSPNGDALWDFRIDLQDTRNRSWRGSGVNHFSPDAADLNRHGRGYVRRSYCA